MQGNILYLQQAKDLVEQLDDAVYQNNDLRPFNSGFGKHLRHLLDFYTAFLQRREGRIDYDVRHRDLSVESMRSAALDRIRSICDALTSIEALDVEVWSNNDETAGTQSSARYRRSTIGRELQFLASHTVHHFAMMSYLLHAQGVAVPPTFGVAPSTLAYWIETGSSPLE